MHPVISPVHDGEFYCIPACKGIELDVSRLPKSLGRFFGYAGFALHSLPQCPDDVVTWFKDITAMRWSPKSKS